MNSIKENISQLKKTLPASVTLVAVSKFNPPENILAAYNSGQRAFGESRANELTEKAKSLPDDIEWHFVGHLQTNKVAPVVALAHTIHSVDSQKLLLEIEKQAALAGRQVNCLLEVHIAREQSKYGLSYSECSDLLGSSILKDLKFARITGLMGMATWTSDMEIVRDEFRRLHNFFTESQQRYFPHSHTFTQLSMGMSHDYPIAIEQGATIVRIGTLIFGQR
jgi:pyridoxal phosphate enzyme (YggS family)